MFISVQNFFVLGFRASIWLGESGRPPLWDLLHRVSIIEFIHVFHTLFFCQTEFHGGTSECSESLCFEMTNALGAAPIKFSKSFHDGLKFCVHGDE